MIALQNQYVTAFFGLIFRDFYVYRSRIPRLIASYSIVYPVLYGLCFGYLLAGVSNSNQAPNVFFVGTILYALFSLTFSLNFEFLFDFESNRTIEYQLQLLPARLLLFQKMLVQTIIATIIMLPFFPLLTTIFSSVFPADPIQWGWVTFLTILACMLCVSLNVLMACAVAHAHQTRIFWRRVNFPLIMLGGFLTPYSAMRHVFPRIAPLALINPILAVTEGLRDSIVGAPVGTFVPAWICTIILLVWICGCFAGACYFFKRKVDHV